MLDMSNNKPVAQIIKNQKPTQKSWFLVFYEYAFWLYNPEF